MSDPPQKTSGICFQDRQQAGQALARALSSYRDQDPVILALPRGGIPIGVEVAQRLQAPLDLIFVRKIGVPGHEELAAAAVVDGGDTPVLVRNEAVIHAAAISDDVLKQESIRKQADIKSLRRSYPGYEKPQSLYGRTAIVVDDGLATGTTAKAALKSVRQSGAAFIILAIPVAPPDTIRQLRAYADLIISLYMPVHFSAVGAFYRDFHQVTDVEAADLLQSLNQAPKQR